MALMRVPAWRRRVVVEPEGAVAQRAEAPAPLRGGARETHSSTVLANASVFGAKYEAPWSSAPGPCAATTSLPPGPRPASKRHGHAGLR